MDEGDFFRRDAHGNELCTDVIVHGKLLILRSGGPLGGGNIAEHQLRQPLIHALLPDPVDVTDAGIDFASRIVRQHGIDQSLIQAQLSAVAGDLQHVVNGRINITAVYFGCAFRECLYQLRLLFGGLHYYRFKVCLGCGQM